jgi:hypothetical protein
VWGGGGLVLYTCPTVRPSGSLFDHRDERWAEQLSASGEGLSSVDILN